MSHSSDPTVPLMSLSPRTPQDIYRAAYGGA